MNDAAATEPSGNRTPVWRPPPGARLLMYLSLAAGVIAGVGLWNHLSEERPPASGMRLHLALGSFPASRGDADLRAGLLRRLADYPALDVSARGVRGDLPAPAFLLEGALEERDGRTHLVARLHDVDEGRVMWSEATPWGDGPAGGTEDRLVEAVARALMIKPAPGTPP